mmetsp:Transcript_21040/g.56634  ORF Transcript_21040/g.56634 Transcript_21040/m.56634 type:complete len:187 (+) Transcript_21040:50-610(+)
MGGYALLSRKKNCHARWGPDVRRDIVFSFSCLAFSFAGMWAMAYADDVLRWLDNGKAGSWPYFKAWHFRREGASCVMQGILSLLSDVIYMDQRSIFHPADRLMAIALTLIALYFELSVIVFSHMPTALRVLQAVLILIGLNSHFAAKLAIVRRQYTLYVRHHSTWHYAIVASMVLPIHLATFGYVR